MIFQSFDLHIDYKKANCEPSSQHPRLDCYIPDVSCEPELHEKRPALVVCPGGGYGMCSEREGEPIALKFAAMGIPAFVLWYSVAPARFPAALLEACESIAIVRRHAAEWHIDPENIHIAGFSAGGHLTATVGTMWNRPFVTDALGYHNEEHRPNGLALCYAVISAYAECGHVGSFQNLLGHTPDEKETAEFSCEKQVGKQTPRSFIWHTCDDPVVPVLNSIRFAEALERCKIPFELHVYPHGQHGLALGDAVTGYGMCEPDVTDWTERCARWMFRKN